MKMTVPRVKIALILALSGLCCSCKSQSPEARAQARTALESEMKTAIAQVIEIVNQPVTRLVRKDAMEVATFGPGWFHQGASKPDYKSVDVRKSRETPYGRHKYVTSDITPGFVFLGSELEFNSMTKYFYIDYNLPKKKLSDSEMEEVNRLYRIIDRCEKDLASL
jgi:hypothetical protein